jgi:hypothetical protein
MTMTLALKRNNNKEVAIPEEVSQEEGKEAAKVSQEVAIEAAMVLMVGIEAAMVLMVASSRETPMENRSEVPELLSVEAEEAEVDTIDIYFDHFIP